MLYILSRSTQVEMSLLGRVRYSYKDRQNILKEKDIFVEVRNYPNAKMVNGTLILSIRNSMYYYNSSTIRSKIEEFLDKVGPFLNENFEGQEVIEPESLKIKRRRIGKISDSKQRINIILDFSHVLSCDSSSCFTLKKMVHAFKKQTVSIYFTGIRPALRELLKDGTVLDELGDDFLCITIEEAVEKLCDDFDDERRNSMTFHELFELKYESGSLMRV